MKPNRVTTLYRGPGCGLGCSGGLAPDDGGDHLRWDDLRERGRHEWHDGQATQLADLADQGRLFDLSYLPAMLAEW